MFRVIPATCMITSAVRIDSGMLTAATKVERTFSRNRKIVRTAKIAPRPPSRSRPSLDSRMNEDWSATVAIWISSGWRAAISSSLAWTSWATVTVFAVLVLVTEIVTAGWPFVRP